MFRNNSTIYNFNNLYGGGRKCCFVFIMLHHLTGVSWVIVRPFSPTSKEAHFNKGSLVSSVHSFFTRPLRSIILNFFVVFFILGFFPLTVRQRSNKT